MNFRGIVDDVAIAIGFGFQNTFHFAISEFLVCSNQIQLSTPSHKNACFKSSLVKFKTDFYFCLKEKFSLFTCLGVF
jgi:hypothetical protein